MAKKLVRLRWGAPDSAPVVVAGLDAAFVSCGGTLLAGAACCCSDLMLLLLLLLFVAGCCCETACKASTAAHSSENLLSEERVFAANAPLRRKKGLSKAAPPMDPIEERLASGLPPPIEWLKEKSYPVPKRASVTEKFRVEVDDCRSPNDGALLVPLLAPSMAPGACDACGILVPPGTMEGRMLPLLGFAPGRVSRGAGFLNAEFAFVVELILLLVAVGAIMGGGILMATVDGPSGEAPSFAHNGMYLSRKACLIFSMTTRSGSLNHLPVEASLCKKRPFLSMTLAMTATAIFVFSVSLYAENNQQSGQIKINKTKYSKEVSLFFDLCKLWIKLSSLYYEFDL